MLADGIVPYSLVSTSTNFQRAAAGLEPANGVRVHVAGIDLVRDGDGVLRVLEDNLRVPSGICYVMENRRTMAQVFPGLFAGTAGPAGPATWHGCSRRCAPPRLAVSTTRPSCCSRPGVYNSAYFEHAFLARKMGVELVEGRDLCLPRQRALHADARRASSGSTSSTAASTTTSSTRCTSGPTR